MQENNTPPSEQAKKERENFSDLTKKKALSEMTFSECNGAGMKFKWLMNYVFIDGMSGMALGLFATLIAGTILWQIGSLIDRSAPNVIGLVLEAIGKIAQIAMGAGIGVGVCVKMKRTQPLVVAAAAASGMIGSYAGALIAAIQSALENGTLSLSLTAAGDPMGAFIGAFSAMALASLVSGKTRVDILVTPLTGLLGGALFGIGLGYPVSLALAAFGDFILWITSLSTLSAVLAGMLLSVLMGVALTMPISSAAIGISVGLSGIAAGASVVGCCCQMVGFAAMSFRENGWGGAAAQGLGTSMLQIPNVFKKPVLLLPPVVASALLGAISPLLPTGGGMYGLLATRTGSGMGTAGLVGPIDMFFEMLSAGCNVWLTLLWILLFCALLPALLCLSMSELMRKRGIIRSGDLKLRL